MALTHGLGDPQIDRSSSPTQDPAMALHVLHETTDGIVIRGAKQLAPSRLCHTKFSFTSRHPLRCVRSNNSCYGLRSQ